MGNAMWSDEDLATARKMRAERKRWTEIAEVVGRTPDAIKRKFRYEQIYDQSVPRLQFQVTAIVVPAIVIEDRDHRLALAPRDLTAAICGDPPPGYSALERR